ncbi:MAG: PH domain-containing protein [Anaerolineae bacterium]|nr:PH domain-containing protein [Phycisphaerae bacterium]
MLKRQSTFAAAQGDAVVAPARAGTSLAALFSGHVLQDGELILLLIKPSWWFILVSSLKFIGVVLILMITAALLDHQLPGRNSVYQELGLFVLAGRVMWAALQWMGRLYILTDLRIVRLSGVFNVEIFDCPLRKVARTRLHRTVRERLTGVGTIEIIPSDEKLPISYWNTVAKPQQVHEQILAAVSRAKQGPGCV